MARRVSMATRVELVEVIVERYRSSCRKHAIRVLRHREAPSACVRQYAAWYGPEVRETLVALWEASDRLCSKRLAATMDRLLSEVRVVASVNVPE
ncbi:hypothetical protein [Aquamicrobium soli]|jgi:hypothetical protein|uniref:Transposase n=1 Tax=Aquamicrobium soli TaxID=1811518 RepID=A0ABV7KB77_9HYPH